MRIRTLSDRIIVDGEIDRSDSPVLADAIVDGTHLVDLRDVTYADSAALEVLARAHQAHGVRVIPSWPIRRLLEITGMGNIIDDQTFGW